MSTSGGGDDIDDHTTTTTTPFTTTIITEHNFKCSFLSYQEFEIFSKTPIKIVEKAEEALDAKERELQQAKGEIEAYSVNQEHVLNKIEQKNQHVKEENERLRAENDKLRTEMAQTNVQATSVQTTVSNLQREIVEERKYRADQDTLIETLRHEKSQALNILNHKSSEIDDLNNQIKELREKLLEQARVTEQKEANINDVASAHLQLEYTIEKLKQERKILEDHNKWLNDQLTSKSQQLLTTKNEMSSKLIDTQTLLQESEERIGHLQAQLNSMREIKNRQETSIQDYLEQIRDLKNEFVSREDDLKMKLNSYRQLSDSYKDALDKSEQKIADLNRERDEMRQNFIREKSDLQASINKMKREFKESQDELEEMKAKLARRDTFEEATTSPSQKASNLVARGITNTDIYAKYIKAEEEVVKAKNENKRLNDVLNSILKHLEEKAPVIQEQREEYERIMSAHVVLTKKYQKLSQDSEKQQTELNNLQQYRQTAEKDIQMFKKENDDMAKQIHALLLECREYKNKLSHMGVDFSVNASALNTTILNNSNISFSENNNNNNSTFATTGGDSMIEENLVTFTDIVQLQDNNRKLLREIHQLRSDRDKLVEQLQGEMKEEFDRKQKQHMEEIEKLRQERETQTKFVQSLIRQRDMYMKLHDELAKQLKEMQQQPQLAALNTSVQSSSSDANSMESNSTTISSHYISARELQKIQEDFNKNKEMIEEKNRQLFQQLNHSNSELARKNAEIAFLSERIKNMTANSESQTRELHNIRESNDKLTRIHIDLQNKLSESNNIIVQLREDVKRVEMEKITIESAKNYTQERVNRLMDQIENLKKENSRLEEFYKTLNDSRLTLEQRDQLSKKQMSAEIDSLKREIEKLKSELEDERVLVKSSKIEQEARQKQLQQVIDTKSSENASLKEELVKSKTQTERLEEDVKSLQNKLAAAESRLTSILDKQILGTSDAILSSDHQELTVQLKETQREIELLNETLRKEREATAEYQRIATASEKALSEQGSAFEQYQNATDEKLKQANIRITSLESELSEAHERIKNLLSELETVKGELDLERQKAQQQQQNLLSNSKETELSLVESERRISTLEQDLNAQIAKTQEAQQNYQSELLKHAADVERLNQYRERVSGLESDLAAAHKKIEHLEASVNSLQESWKTQERTLKSQIEDVDKHLESIKNENVLLHSQMEQLNIENKKLRASSSPMSNVETAPDTQENMSQSRLIEELRELVRILRRDKEILSSKLSIAEQEVKCDSQRLEETLRLLEETRLQLQAEKTQNSKLSSSAMSDDAIRSLQEQLNLFRESNQTLRAETANQSRTIEEWKDRLNSLQSELKPLQQQVETLKTENEILKSENVQLQNDVNKWQERSRTLLEKYKQIDPEEHKNLQEQLATVQAERDQLKKQVEDLQQSLESTSSSQSNVQIKLSTLKEHIVNLKSQLTNSQKEVKNVTSQAEADKQVLEEEKSKLTQENSQVNAKLTRAMSVLRGIKQKLSDAQEEKTKLQSEKDELEQKIEEVEQKLQQVTSEKKTIELRMNVLKSMKQRQESSQQPQQNQPTISTQPATTTERPDSPSTATAKRNLKRVVTPTSATAKTAGSKRTAEHLDEVEEGGADQDERHPVSKKPRVEDVEQEETVVVEEPTEDSEMADRATPTQEEEQDIEVGNRTPKHVQISEEQDESDTDDKGPRRRLRRPRINRPAITSITTEDTTQRDTPTEEQQEASHESGDNNEGDNQDLEDDQQQQQYEEAEEEEDDENAVVDVAEDDVVDAGDEENL